VAARKALYEKFDGIVVQELPIIYLYFAKWIWGMPTKLAGFTPYPDGMIRLEGREARAVTPSAAGSWRERCPAASLLAAKRCHADELPA
jgi:hypothetical protein